LNRRVLIVSEDLRLARGLNHLLSGEPVEQIQMRSGQACMDLIVNTLVDIVVIDDRLADMQAVDLVKSVKSARPDINVILAAFKHSIQQEIEARQEGASYCAVGSNRYNALYQFLLQATG
jgi:two-component system, NtrC family, response regulator